jgi:GCN5-like protein 1 (GCN5L1)
MWLLALLWSRSPGLRRARLPRPALALTPVSSPPISGVAEVFNNQRVIEAEARELQAQASQFGRLTARWVGLVNGFDASLKEVGDFENWVKVMEWDLQAISTGLEAAAQAAAAGGGSGSGASAGGQQAGGAQ